MGRALREAIGGRSRERQELADTAIPLEITVAPLPARAGGPDLVRRLFEPWASRRLRNRAARSATVELGNGPLRDPPAQRPMRLASC